MIEKIFVSCAYEDRKYLDAIEKALRKEGVIKGDEVQIIDPLQETTSLKSIRDAIREQIQSSSKVIIVSSEKSNSSQWVNYEAGMAEALEKQIIVVGKKGMTRSNFLSNLSSVNYIEIDGLE